MDSRYVNDCCQVSGLSSGDTSEDELDSSTAKGPKRPAAAGSVIAAVDFGSDFQAASGSGEPSERGGNAGVAAQMLLCLAQQPEPARPDASSCFGVRGHDEAMARPGHGGGGGDAGSSVGGGCAVASVFGGAGCAFGSESRASDINLVLGGGRLLVRQVCDRDQLSQLLVYHCFILLFHIVNGSGAPY
jgi:hypothetical protein